MLATGFRNARSRFHFQRDWVDPQIIGGIFAVWFQTTSMLFCPFGLVTAGADQEEIAPNKSGQRIPCLGPKMLYLSSPQERRFTESAFAIVPRFQGLAGVLINFSALVLRPAPPGARVIFAQPDVCPHLDPLTCPELRGWASVKMNHVECPWVCDRASRLLSQGLTLASSCSKASCSCFS